MRAPLPHAGSLGAIVGAARAPRPSCWPPPRRRPRRPTPGPEEARRPEDRRASRTTSTTPAAPLKTAYTDLHATQDKLPAAQAALEQARGAAEAADAAEAAAAQELEVAKANEAKARADLRRRPRRVAAGRKRVAQFAAQIYQQQGFGQLDVALSSTQPQEFADRLAMVDTVLDVQNATMERLATEQADLTALEDPSRPCAPTPTAKQKAAAAALAARRGRPRCRREAPRPTSRPSPRPSAGPGRRGFADQVAADKKQLCPDAGRAGPAAQGARRPRRGGPPRGRAADAKAAAEAKKNHSSGGGTSSEVRTSSGGSSNSSGVLSRPVRTGWVSSEFGMRFHPI